MEITDDTKVWLYRKMLEIRAFEERAIELFTAGQLPGFLHSQLGQEAIPAGVGINLRPDDYICTTHRGHGDVIAKGARMDRMFAELFAKETGYCRAKGGSMHIAAFDLNILGANGIVGAGLPIATGAALSAKMRGTDQVTVVYFGDGASNQGTFHESLNLASVWNLPVVFVCQNNQYAESTAQSIHQKVRDISIRAVGYDMPGITVDGNDALAVCEAASGAIRRARSGGGPTLLECKTYRWMGHYIGDPGVYRTPEEVESWKQRDPVRRLHRHLLEAGILDEADCRRMAEEVRQQVEEAVAFAQASPEPAPEEALEDVYAP